MESNPLEFIGQRIRFAREERGMNQEDLSLQMGFRDRQILSNIERGTRKVSSEELLKLMKFLDKDLEFFTDPFLLAGEAQFSWRSASPDPEELAEFEIESGRWISVYRRLGNSLNEPCSLILPQLALTTRSSFEDAQLYAQRLQIEWQLGDIPSKELRHVIEEKLQVLVLDVEMPEGLSGAACRLPDTNTILINSKEPSGRRNYDLAHELFHILTWATLPPDRIDQEPSSRAQKRIEQLAQNFAGALLMPEKTVIKLWNEGGVGEEIHDKLNRLANVMDVTAVALRWRAYVLQLISRSENEAIDEDMLAWNGSEPQLPTELLPFSREFMGRVSSGLMKGHISFRKAAKSLSLSSSGLEDLLSKYGFPSPFES